MTITQVQPSRDYPGKTTITVDGRTFVMFGPWSRQECVEAVAERVGGDPAGEDRNAIGEQG